MRQISPHGQRKMRGSLPVPRLLPPSEAETPPRKSSFEHLFVRARVCPCAAQMGLCAPRVRAADLPLPRRW
ncbi:hypothetical protein CgunFtcFv8_021578 [Champsocephalus gunnari]|uniref:Uncharacterized protein n=1 Tax=Champsocephalus gunnari TaxID=52237 RepID=A0AAN8DN87_CHAGU|nr:hypothetical protein CgunFtcFv8_021578 [Champsocephalus gunnari]